jgi:hypothetical protein
MKTDLNWININEDLLFSILQFSTFNDIRNFIICSKELFIFYQTNKGENDLLPRIFDNQNGSPALLPYFYQNGKYKYNNNNYFNIDQNYQHSYQVYWRLQNLLVSQNLFQSNDHDQFKKIIEQQHSYQAKYRTNNNNNNNQNNRQLFIRLNLNSNQNHNDESNDFDFNFFFQNIETIDLTKFDYITDCSMEYLLNFCNSRHKNENNKNNKKKIKELKLPQGKYLTLKSLESIYFFIEAGLEKLSLSNFFLLNYSLLWNNNNNNSNQNQKQQDKNIFINNNLNNNDNYEKFRVFSLEKFWSLNYCMMQQQTKNENGNNNDNDNNITYSSMKYLNLSNNSNITWENISKLINKFPNLKYLNLSNCPNIRNINFLHFQNSSCRNSLRKVDLSQNNQLQYSDITNILYNCPKLLKLDVRKCQQIQSNFNIIKDFCSSISCNIQKLIN